MYKLIYVYKWPIASGASGGVTISTQAVMSCLF